MENASKALTMAGALLISLVIISALVLVFRGISNSQKTSSKTKSEKQISDFNKSFTSFERTLYGSELLSLINKAVDYNEKNEEEGFVPIKITFIIKTGTGNDNSNSIVRSGQRYEVTYKNQNVIASTLLEEIEEIKKVYKGDKYLQRLIDLNNKYETYSGSEKADAKREIEDLLDDLGIANYDSGVRSDLNKYSEYIEFKRKRFEFVETKFDGEQAGARVSSTNGRIVQMEYEEK